MQQQKITKVFDIIKLLNCLDMQDLKDTWLAIASFATTMGERSKRQFTYYQLAPLNTGCFLVWSFK